MSTRSARSRVSVGRSAEPAALDARDARQSDLHHSRPVLGQHEEGFFVRSQQQQAHLALVICAIRVASVGAPADHTPTRIRRTQIRHVRVQETLWVEARQANRNPRLARMKGRRGVDQVEQQLQVCAAPRAGSRNRTGEVAMGAHVARLVGWSERQGAVRDRACADLVHS